MYVPAADDVTGEEAVVDTTLVDIGTLVAASPDFVDLSWEAADGVTSYRVYRDDVLVAETADTSWRDLDVTPGAEYSYRIERVFAPDAAPSDDIQVTGVDARVPNSDMSMSEAATQTEDAVTAMIIHTGSGIQVRTFIPQNRIDAPPAGCSYGSGYQFDGDGRGFTNAIDASHRTDMTAGVLWTDNNPRLSGYSKDIGQTVVYKKSTGAVVARKTASAADVWVKELGSDNDQVDLRFSIQARNPFCWIGSIAGAFTMNVYKNGNWAIRSGSHRQMPNWEITIGWTGGTRHTVYRRSYANVTCLIEMACEEADMGGYVGSY
jgi:hypothetical protein